MSRFKVLRVLADDGRPVGYLRRGGLAHELSLGTKYSAPSAVALAIERGQKRFPLFKFVPVDWLTGQPLSMPKKKETTGG